VFSVREELKFYVQFIWLSIHRHKLPFLKDHSIIRPNHTLQHQPAHQHPTTLESHKLPPYPPVRLHDIPIKKLTGHSHARNIPREPLRSAATAWALDLAITTFRHGSTAGLHRTGAPATCRCLRLVQNNYMSWCYQRSLEYIHTPVMFYWPGQRIRYSNSLRNKWSGYWNQGGRGFLHPSRPAKMTTQTLVQ
jgi:hypothetical protein